jgi:hypothetical protein
MLLPLLFLLSLSIPWPAHSANGAAGEKSAKSEPAQRIFFKELKGFDVEKKTSTPELTKLLEKTIKIPGFMVPLEYKSQKVDQFLLVQSIPSCIHVPPPPPNQTILVKMKAKKSVPLSWDPIYVTGKLTIVKQDKYVFGDAVYTMEGLETEPVAAKDFGNVGLFMGDENALPPLEGNPFGEESPKKKKK